MGTTRNTTGNVLCYKYVDDHVFNLVFEKCNLKLPRLLDDNSLFYQKYFKKLAAEIDENPSSRSVLANLHRYAHPAVRRMPEETYEELYNTLVEKGHLNLLADFILSSNCSDEVFEKILDATDENSTAMETIMRMPRGLSFRLMKKIIMKFSHNENLQNAESVAELFQYAFENPESILCFFMAVLTKSEDASPEDLMKTLQLIEPLYKNAPKKMQWSLAGLDRIVKNLIKNPAFPEEGFHIIYNMAVRKRYSMDLLNSPRCPKNLMSQLQEDIGVDADIFDSPNCPEALFHVEFPSYALASRAASPAMPEEVMKKEIEDILHKKEKINPLTILGYLGSSKVTEDIKRLLINELPQDLFNDRVAASTIFYADVMSLLAKTEHNVFPHLATFPNAIRQFTESYCIPEEKVSADLLKKLMNTTDDNSLKEKLILPAIVLNKGTPLSMLEDFKESSKIAAYMMLRHELPNIDTNVIYDIVESRGNYSYNEMKIILKSF